VDDTAFTTAGGGYKDLSTGLVWSPDLRALGGGSTGVSGDGVQQSCNNFLNDVAAGGGYTDWRPATVGEINKALANGLNTHLDFFLNGSPDDGVYRWTACTKTIRGDFHRYAVRYSDGNLVLFNLSRSEGGEGVFNICVRGLPANPTNDCPSTRKNNSPSTTNTYSQSSTGALLLLPLAVVLAARCLRPRRP
jgi:hypothetical protein